MIKHLLFLFLLAACTSGVKSTYKTYQQKYYFVGGQSKDKSWDDKLVFTKTAWFQEANMVNDLYIAELDRESPFTSWLEDKEKIYQKCQRFFVMFTYAMFEGPSTASEMLDKIEKQGLIEELSPSLKSNVKARYEYLHWNLSQYRIRGYCLPYGEKLDHIRLSVPGFNELVVF